MLGGGVDAATQVSALIHTGNLSTVTYADGLRVNPIALKVSRFTQGWIHLHINLETQTVYNIKGTRAHTHRELIERGASRATKGQEALWPPVLKARRRHKRQRLHRCRRKCRRRRRRLQ